MKYLIILLLLVGCADQERAERDAYRRIKKEERAKELCKKFGTIKGVTTRYQGHVNGGILCDINTKKEQYHAWAGEQMRGMDFMYMLMKGEL